MEEMIFTEQYIQHYLFLGPEAVSICRLVGQSSWSIRK